MNKKSAVKRFSSSKSTVTTPSTESTPSTQQVHERIDSLIEKINDEAIVDCERASMPPAEVKSCLEEAARLGWEDVSRQFTYDYHGEYILQNVRIMLDVFNKEGDLHWTFNRRVRLKPPQRSWVNQRYIWDLKDDDGGLRGVVIDESRTKNGMIAASFAFYTSKTVQTILAKIDDVVNLASCIQEGLDDELSESGVCAMSARKNVLPSTEPQSSAELEVMEHQRKLFAEIHRLRRTKLPGIIDLHPHEPLSFIVREPSVVMIEMDTETGVFLRVNVTSLATKRSFTADADDRKRFYEE